MQQRELTRIKYRRASDWKPWPLHIAAPTGRDIEGMRAAYHEGSPLGKRHELSPVLFFTFHRDFVWYFDGEHSIVFAAIMLPDGTTWTYRG
jgi:hypothetical protein